MVRMCHLPFTPTHTNLLWTPALSIRRWILHDKMVHILAGLSLDPVWTGTSPG